MNEKWSFIWGMSLNRGYGIRLFTNDQGVGQSKNERGNVFGSVKFYNNLIIDSHVVNIGIVNPQDFALVNIYNNVFILYDRTGSGHIQELYNYTDDPNVTVSGSGGLPCTGGGGDWAYCNGAVWTIDNNAFWTTGGSTAVDIDWKTNYIIANPLLPGESATPPVNWDGQSGPTYFIDIQFSDIFPSAGSPLIGNWRTIGSGFNNNFLTNGTNWTPDPTASTWQLAAQGAALDIGPAVYSSGGDTTPPDAPTGLEIVE